MDPMRELGKLLLVVGAIFACAGIAMMFGMKLPFRLGHLPGDISYHGRNGSSFYFPVVTCIVVSVALTLIFWVVNLFRR
jgi:hypothetical protein